jgi:hypothetical protein
MLTHLLLTCIFSILADAAQVADVDADADGRARPRGFLSVSTMNSLNTIIESVGFAIIAIVIAVKIKHWIDKRNSKRRTQTIARAK